MKLNWPVLPIGDIAQIFDGPHATPKKSTEGPIFLGISSLDNGRLNLSETEHLSEEDFVKWTRRVLPQTGDMVFSYETRIGQAAIIPEGLRCCLGRRLALIRVDKDKLDSKFLLYQYLSPAYQDFLKSRTVPGSTVDRISLKEFPNFPISVPPLSEQQQIASILSSLDDKIELNRRMNQTLEQLAQTLFRQWFLSSDEDREQELLSELIDFDPKTPVKKGTQTRFLPMTEVPTQGFAIGTLEERPYSGGAKFRQGDTLLARITPCLENGKTAYVDFLDENEIAAGSTEFIVMRGKGAVSSEFVYCLARSNEFRKYAIAQMVGTSGRQRVSTESLGIYSFPKPQKGQLIKFGLVTQPLFARISANNRESRTLATLRDTLLPQLLSGRLTVRQGEELVAQS